MEEISKIHLDLIFSKENKENLVHSESITFGEPSDDSEIFDDEQIPAPDGLLDFEVDLTDSKILASLYNDKRDDVSFYK